MKRLAAVTDSSGQMGNFVSLRWFCRLEIPIFHGISKHATIKKNLHGRIARIWHYSMTLCHSWCEWNLKKFLWLVFFYLAERLTLSLMGNLFVVWLLFRGQNLTPHDICVCHISVCGTWSANGVHIYILKWHFVMSVNMNGSFVTVWQEILSKISCSRVKIGVFCRPAISIKMAMTAYFVMHAGTGLAVPGPHFFLFSDPSWLGRCTSKHFCATWLYFVLSSLSYRDQRRSAAARLCESQPQSSVKHRPSLTACVVNLDILISVQYK